MVIQAWRAFWLRWLVGAFGVVVIDGAFLGGIAAIISAIGALLLGVLAYWKGHKAGRSTEADAWRLLYEASEREKDALRREVADDER